MYISILASAGLNVIAMALPSGSTFIISAVVSTWPFFRRHYQGYTWTKCPPKRTCPATALSRLTLLPSCNSPRFVRLKVSGAIPTLNDVVPSYSVTVRHVPYSAWLWSRYTIDTDRVTQVDILEDGADIHYDC